MEQKIDQELIGHLYLELADGSEIHTQVYVVDYKNQKLLCIKQEIAHTSVAGTFIFDAHQMDLLIDMLMSAENKML